MKWGKSFFSRFLAHFKTNVINVMVVQILFKEETCTPNTIKID